MHVYVSVRVCVSVPTLDALYNWPCATTKQCFTNNYIGVTEFKYEIEVIRLFFIFI